MNLCNNLTAPELEHVVRNINYAVVNGQGDDVRFVNINGREVANTSELTVPEFRAKYNGSDNAIIYVKSAKRLELIINLDNGFCVHAINDLENKGGRAYLEVAIKRDGKVLYNTPLTSSVIHMVTLDELSVIVNHVKNLVGDGSDYRRLFTPNARYAKRGVVASILSLINRIGK